MTITPTIGFAAAALLTFTAIGVGVWWAHRVTHARKSRDLTVRNRVWGGYTSAQAATGPLPSMPAPRPHSQADVTAIPTATVVPVPPPATRHMFGGTATGPTAIAVPAPRTAPAGPADPTVADYVTALAPGLGVDPARVLAALPTPPTAARHRRGEDGPAGPRTTEFSATAILRRLDHDGSITGALEDAR